MNPLQVLVVSYTFPPQAAVGSIRISQFCRYLPEYEIEPIVLSVEERFYESLDQSRALPASLQVFRTTRMSTPLEWYARTKRFLQARPESESNLPGDVGPQTDKSWLRENLLACLQIPDREWGWYLPAIRKAAEIFDHRHVDVVFSSGPPWTSHLVARHLKTKFGVPWLADFRDPWASVKPRTTGPAWAHRLATRLERSCVQMADMVLCNTDRLRQALQSYYSDLSSAKFRTLTNGFGDLSVTPLGKTGSKPLILHLGSIYGRRQIDTFLVALVNLVSSGRLDTASFRVVFQGDVKSSHLAEASRIAPDLLKSKCVEFLPRTDWEQARQLLWQSDLLLLFQGSQALQVPAKFYEYLQTGIPMFAVTEEGALTDLLQSTASGVWATPRDPEAIADSLLHALRLPRCSPEEVGQRLESQFHYRVLTKELSVLIRELSART